jgi:hypothetical protein
VEKHIVAPLARWLLANLHAQNCTLQMSGTLDALAMLIEKQDTR